MISAARRASQKRSAPLGAPAAAAMIVQSERLQSAVLRGELVDVEQLTRLANAATRILSRLGIKRERRDSTPTIAEIAARHRAPGVAAE